MRTLLVLLLLAAPAVADDPKEKPLGHPVPAVFPTPDQNHALVLIPPVDPKHPDDAIQRAIRERYPAGSGLYRAGDPSAPVWAVDWYAYEAFPANDARSVVRMHGDSILSRHFLAGHRLPDAQVAEQLAGPGLSFYRDGKLLRTYAVNELVADPDRLPHTMQHVLWLAGGTVTADGTRFVLLTQDSRRLTFDLATGDLLSAKSAGLGDQAQVWAMRVALAAVGTGVVLAVGLWLYFSRVRKPATA
jgi:hypothetical protein